MWDGGGEEAASWRYHCLTLKYEGSKGGEPSDRHHGPWLDISGTTLRTQMDIPGRGELDVVNVEGGEKYLGTGGIHIRDGTTGFIQCGH